MKEKQNYQKGEKVWIEVSVERVQNNVHTAGVISTAKSSLFFESESLREHI